MLHAPVVMHPLSRAPMSFSRMASWLTLSLLMFACGCASLHRSAADDDTSGSNDTTMTSSPDRRDATGRKRPDINDLARRINDGRPVDAREAAARLVAELRDRAMPDGDGASVGVTGRLVVTPTVLARGRAQTLGTGQMTRLLAEAARPAFRSLQVVVPDQRSARDAEWSLTSAIVTTTAAGDGKTLRETFVCAYLVRLANGHVVGAATQAISPAALDLTPSRLDRDRVLLSSQAAGIDPDARCDDEEVARSAGSGRSAVVSALALQPAIAQYNAGNDAAAERAFGEISAGGEIDGQALWTGRYLSAVRRRGSGADTAMRALIEPLGGAGEFPLNLGFAPGSTRSSADRVIAARHDDWLRAIARRAEQAGRCIDVFGHASKAADGGGATARLAEERALAVRRRIEGFRLLGPGTVRTQSRLDAADIYSGLGTADLRDQWDRRVDVAVTPC